MNKHGVFFFKGGQCSPVDCNSHSKILTIALDWVIWGIKISNMDRATDKFLGSWAFLPSK